MNIKFRKANRSDLSDILRLLTEDNISAKREKYTHPLPESYYVAFDLINSDKNNYLMVAELNNKVVGSRELATNIHYLFNLSGWQAGTG